MKIEYSESGFFPENINPKGQLELKELIHKNYGTTHRILGLKVLEGMEKIIKLQRGALEEVELVDQEAGSLLTHIRNPDKTLIFRKNQRRDLTRISIHNIPKKLYNTIINYLNEHYGTKYGSLSDLMNQAIELMIKVENGFIELVETDNKSIRSFISDDEGQISSVDGNSILGVFEFLTSRVIELQNDIKDIKESTVQSASNISSKVVGKVKKISDGKGKSGKAKAKLDKAERILNNLKRRYEHRFTNREYGEPLAKLEKQGDDRTVRSDLKTLKAAGLIKKVRSSANGEETYEFTENTEYYKYNSDLGKTRFFDDFKEKFSDQDAFKLDDLNKFIFEKYELFDDESQNKRLRWLLDEGCVRRHDVNPRLLIIQK